MPENDADEVAPNEVTSSSELDSKEAFASSLSNNSSGLYLINLFILV